MAVHSYPRATLDWGAQSVPFTSQVGAEKISASRPELQSANVASPTLHPLPASPIKGEEPGLALSRSVRGSRAKASDSLCHSPNRTSPLSLDGRGAGGEGDRGALIGISVVSLEGLIELKSLCLSAQDQADIENLRSLLDET